MISFTGKAKSFNVVLVGESFRPLFSRIIPFFNVVYVHWLFKFLSAVWVSKGHQNQTSSVERWVEEPFSYQPTPYY